MGARKGRIPWNKGKVGLQIAWNKDKHGIEYLSHYKNGHPRYRKRAWFVGLPIEKHPRWKGDDVGYVGVHAWIKRYKPKFDVCENCHENKPLEAANISGEYKRDINDFKWICRRCHMESDGRLHRLIEKNKSEEHIIELEKINNKRWK